MLLETQKSFLITLKPRPAEAGQSCQGAVQILFLIWAGAKQMGAHLCHCKKAAFLIPSHFMAGLIPWRSLVCWPCCCAASPAARAPARSTVAEEGTLNCSESRALEASNGTQSYHGRHSQKTSFFSLCLESYWKEIWIALCKNIYSVVKSEIRKCDVAPLF